MINDRLLIIGTGNNFTLATFPKSPNRRMVLNIIAPYGHSLYVLVNGLDVDDGARVITD